MKETILSAGIDIGTSTTQMVFSEIRIENIASLVSVPRLKIMGKQVIHASDIYFTPLLSATEIDGRKIRTLLQQEYTKAGVSPAQVKTGAVIITGETARKSNAAQVLETLSGLAGEFVVATAGPALEGIIAGKGANAHALSKEKGAVVANLDIGGGTTNIAVFRNGEVIDTACLDIGGRLVRFSDCSGRIEFCTAKINAFAGSLGIRVQKGAVLDRNGIEKLAEAMTGILEQVLGIAPRTRQLDVMKTDKVLTLDYSIDYLSFSGGVADCLNRPADSDPFAFGDMGVFLGNAIAGSKRLGILPVLPAKETIRATVVGAGSHTTDISGSTVTFCDDVLPVRNVPILKLSAEDEAVPISDWGKVIARKLDWFSLKEENQMPAIAFKGPDAIGFDELQTLSDSIIAGMNKVMSLEAPLMVIVENDLAKALGQALSARLGRRKQVICIDTVKVENGDYVDIGKGLANGRVVPVIVKTLVFGY
jgi:ethanolamine utilization protein EutA